MGLIEPICHRPGASLALLGVALAGLLGCSGLGGTTQLPLDARTLEPPVFVNRTEMPGLEADLAKEVALAVEKNGRLIIKAGEADLKLTGEVQSFKVIPLRFDEFGAPIQFKMLLAVDLELTDNKRGAQLWTTHRLVHLTPLPSDAKADSFDSNNSSTLFISHTYWGLNRLGEMPVDRELIRQKLIRIAAEKIYVKLVTGFYGGTP